jgi:hypothetical protein
MCGSFGDFVEKWQDITDSISFLSCAFVSMYNKCAHEFWYDLHIIKYDYMYAVDTATSFILTWEQNFFDKIFHVMELM